MPIEGAQREANCTMEGEVRVPRKSPGLYQTHMGVFSNTDSWLWPPACTARARRVGLSL